MGLHSQARATIMTFDNQAAFLTATVATSATGPLPNLGQIPGGTTGSQTVGAITFSIAPPSTNFYIGSLGVPNPADFWTTLLPGIEIAISDVENLNADLAGPVFSLGFDFAEPTSTAECRAPCFDSTFMVTLKQGGTVVDNFSFNAPNNVAAFVGVWSDMPFNRVELRDTTATIDDEFFGQFYTGLTPLSTPIPEPTTVALMLSGVALLTGLRWWRLQRS
jgi:hypothetical protein